MIANCPWLDEKDNNCSGTSEHNSPKSINKSVVDDNEKGNPLSYTKMGRTEPSVSAAARRCNEYGDIPYRPLENCDYASPIHYSDEFHREYEDSYYEVKLNSNS